jgi:hypothetical protein
MKKMKDKLTILFMLSLLFITIASADTTTLVNSSGQIYTYNITINKTSNNTGINTFELVSNMTNIDLPSAYQNCTITNVVSCNVIFIAEQGTWSSINVIDNGNVVGSIPLSNPISYNPPQQLQKEYIEIGYSIIPYVLIAITIILIAGNIIYYELKKEEL